MVPRWANWKSCWARVSTFAPASIRRVWPFRVGSTVPIAGRSTPWRGRRITSEPAITAPVDPALMKASTSPCLWRLSPTTMEESGFRRIAWAGDSPISIRCVAWTISTRSRGSSGCWRSSASIVSRFPTRTSWKSPSRDWSAPTAPATSMAGARSEPIASSAIRMAAERALELFDFEPLHLPIVAAGRAHAMRNVRVSAARAVLDRRHRRLHVGATLALTLLGLALLRYGHEVVSRLWGQSNLSFLRASHALGSSSGAHAQVERLRSVPHVGAQTPTVLPAERVLAEPAGGPARGVPDADPARRCARGSG